MENDDQLSSELRFDGQVAVITGAGRGIGRTHALLLARRGAAIVVNDLGVQPDGTGSSSEAESVAAEIRSAGGRAIARTDSVATPEGAAPIVATALDSFGHIDILINNAGIITKGSIVDYPIEELHRTMEINLFGTYLVTRAAWPTLIAHGGGRIINTTSIAFQGGRCRLHTAPPRPPSTGSPGRWPEMERRSGCQSMRSPPADRPAWSPRQRKA